MAATKRETWLVAKALRQSGDEEVFALFGTGPEPDSNPEFDREACRRVAEIAERAGAGGLVALDLYTAVVNPGWSPFPEAESHGADEDAPAEA